MHFLWEHTEVERRMEFSSSRLRELNGRSLQIEPRVGKFRVSSDSLSIRFFFPSQRNYESLEGERNSGSSTPKAHYLLQSFPRNGNVTKPDCVFGGKAEPTDFPG